MMMFDPTAPRPEVCQQADPDNVVCQLEGKYTLHLNKVGALYFDFSHLLFYGRASLSRPHMPMHIAHIMSSCTFRVIHIFFLVRSTTRGNLTATWERSVQAWHRRTFGQMTADLTALRTLRRCGTILHLSCVRQKLVNVHSLIACCWLQTMRDARWVHCRPFSFTRAPSSEYTQTQNNNKFTNKMVLLPFSVGPSRKKGHNACSK